MCDIGRRIWQRGFCAGNEGNHTCRLDDRRILSTPTGVSKGVLKPSDLCVVDLSGRQIGGTRTVTSEIRMHLAIYNARADIRCVIHSHPPHATAFAVAGIDLPTCVHPEADYFLGPVRSAAYVTPGDNRLGESILPHVHDSNTILLQNHGVTTWGTDLEWTYYRLEIVDNYARILLLAAQLGQVNPISPRMIRELLELKRANGVGDPRIVGDRFVGLTDSGGFMRRMSPSPGRKPRTLG